MHARLTIDSAGQVIIPELLRNELDLQPGDALELDSAGDQITLRPLRSADRLVKEHGVWVIGTGVAMTAEHTEGILNLIRRDRESSQLIDP